MKRIFSLILTLSILTSILFIPIKSAAVSPTMQAGRVSLSSGRLNVRASPSTGGRWLASLTAGATVTLLEQSGDWWRVEYADGKYGYCHGDYLTPLGGKVATVATSGSRLNVRSGAGTSHSRIASLADGEEVIVLSSSGGWARVLFRGAALGYVSEEYLATRAAYPAVSLTVPYFKQTDSRWSRVTLGTSGKTIGKVGCATTSIAMIESYRTGSTITPDAMAKRLTYTSSANVYWPSHYTLVTGYSLETIYTLLASGKPVLLGAKNGSGGQHWIVVTGYRGGDRLTASGFTIHDPAATWRRTLTDFFNAYPYFYKMFYY
jgi:uncharacterized protein YgiM (DUF1202 family)